jgi:hypothetical protein
MSVTSAVAAKSLLTGHEAPRPAGDSRGYDRGRSPPMIPAIWSLKEMPE